MFGPACLVRHVWSGMFGPAYFVRQIRPRMLCRQIRFRIFGLHAQPENSGSAHSADKLGSAHSARQIRPRTFCPQPLRLHGENLAVLPSDLVF